MKLLLYLKFITAFAAILLFLVSTSGVVFGFSTNIGDCASECAKKSSAESRACLISEDEDKEQCYCGGGLIPLPTGENCEYTFCDFFTMINSAIDKIMIFFAPIIASLFIIYGAFVWITSGGVPEKISQGRKLITYAVIGLILTWSAWLIIDFIMQFSLQENFFEQDWNWPWQNILCV